MRKTVAAFVMGMALIASSLVFAQGTATPSKSLGWDQPGVTSAAEAQALSYKYYADGATTGVALTGVTCAGSAPVACQAPFPAFTPGAHTVQLSATNAAGEGPKSAVFSFTFVVVPGAPTGLRIQ